MNLSVSCRLFRGRGGGDTRAGCGSRVVIAAVIVAGGAARCRIVHPGPPAEQRELNGWAERLSIRADRFPSGAVPAGSGSCCLRPRRPPRRFLEYWDRAVTWIGSYRVAIEDIGDVDARACTRVFDSPRPRPYACGSRTGRGRSAPHQRPAPSARGQPAAGWSRRQRRASKTTRTRRACSAADKRAETSSQSMVGMS